MTEEANKPELTTYQKIQLEYNQTCAMYGHTITQMRSLRKDAFRLRERMESLTKKAANISQKERELQSALNEEIIKEPVLGEGDQNGTNNISEG